MSSEHTISLILAIATGTLTGAPLAGLTRPPHQESLGCSSIFLLTGTWHSPAMSLLPWGTHSPPSPDSISSALGAVLWWPGSPRRRRPQRGEGLFQRTMRHQPPPPRGKPSATEESPAGETPFAHAIFLPLRVRMSGGELAIGGGGCEGCGFAGSGNPWSSDVTYFLRTRVDSMFVRIGVAGPPPPPTRC